MVDATTGPNERVAARRFPRKMRLVGRDFRRVYRARHSAADDVLIVYGLHNDLEYSRLGMTVARRVGAAHERNYWKRLIREAFRGQIDRLPCGLDYVVLPRSKERPTLAAVTRSLLKLAARVARQNRK